MQARLFNPARHIGAGLCTRPSLKLFASAYRVNPTCDARGCGAPKGAATLSFRRRSLRSFDGPRSFATRARRLPALHMWLFCPRGRSFRAGAGASWPPFSRPAFASLGTRLVQPSKADPRSGTGRRPEASRVRGYELRPQAPHLPQRPASVCRTPLALEKMMGLYAHLYT